MLIEKVPIKNKDMKDIYQASYLCEWCNYKFDLIVGKYEGGGKHNNISSQVKCPMCKNKIRTWE